MTTLFNKLAELSFFRLSAAGPNEHCAQARDPGCKQVDQRRATLRNREILFWLLAVVRKLRRIFFRWAGGGRG